MTRLGWLGVLAATAAIGGMVLLRSVLATPAPPADDTRTDSAANQLQLTISAKDPTVTMGQPMALDINLTNRGQTPLSLVLPGDGSECGWRTPVVGWSVVPASDAAARHPDTPPLYRGGRCGNVNPLTSKEIIILGPGQTRTLSGWAGLPALPGPGTYKVVFYYTNDPAMPIKGVPLGQHGNEALELVKKSHKCALRSNELLLEVKAAK